MGLFDYVRCEMPLPWPEAAEFEFAWQTKDTPNPYCERWEIRRDGTLWHEEPGGYEDHSDPNAEPGSFLSLAGCMTPVNHRWVQVKWNGEFEIYHLVNHSDRPGRFWYEVRFWFRDGVVKDVLPSKRDSQPLEAISAGVKLSGGREDVR